MKKALIIVVVIIVILSILLIYQNYSTRDTIKDAKSTLVVKSPAFKHGEMIPAKYTCESEDISPAIFWDHIPEGTKSFVLIATDYDAPSEYFPILTIIHWIIYNIPSDTLSLPEGIAKDPELKNGAKQGNNSLGKIGYIGPCPPMGTHDYHFKVYALDMTIDIDSQDATKSGILEAAKGHVLGIGELVGKYKKQE